MRPRRVPAPEGVDLPRGTAQGDGDDILVSIQNVVCRNTTAARTTCTLPFAARYLDGPEHDDAHRATLTRHRRTYAVATQARLHRRTKLSFRVIRPLAHGR